MNPKTIISLLAIPLALLMLLAAPAAMQAQFNTTLNGGNLTITHYVGSGGAVTIPATIAGRPVTAIGDDAFADIGSVISVSIPISRQRNKHWE
jgi:hypothetical protein